MEFVAAWVYSSGNKLKGGDDVDGLKIFEERLKGHAEKLEEHEHRLNDNEKRIRHQETHEGVVDESVRNVCKRVDGLTKALWAVAMAMGSAALAFIFDLLK